MSGSIGTVTGAPNLAVIDAVTQFVGGTQTVWNSVTIPIPAGLVVYAVDTTAIKLGDGITLYANLPVLFQLNAISSLTAQLASLTSAEAGFITAAAVNTAIGSAITAALSGYTTTAAITASLAGYAALNGATFTASPQVPTAPVNDASQNAASTAYVDRAIAAVALEAAAGITPTQLQADITAALSDYVLTTTLTTDLQAYAPLSLVRRLLTANLTLNINAVTGNDSTGDGTSGNPFATPQGAYNYAVKYLDLGGAFQVLFNIGAGSYGTTTIQGRLVGQAYPGQVVFSGAGATTILGGTAPGTVAFNAANGAQATLRDVAVQNSNFAAGNAGNAYTTSGYGISAWNGSQLVLAGTITLAACGFNQLNAAVSSSILAASATINVTGGSTCLAYADVTGYISLTLAHVTFTSAVAYSTSVLATAGGRIDLFSTTWTNPANVTGTRYVILDWGFIFTNGAGGNYIPGTAAGMIATYTANGITSNLGTYQ